MREDEMDPSLSSEEKEQDGEVEYVEEGEAGEEKDEVLVLSDGEEGEDSGMAQEDVEGDEVLEVPDDYEEEEEEDFQQNGDSNSMSNDLVIKNVQGNMNGAGEDEVQLLSDEDASNSNNMNGKGNQGEYEEDEEDIMEVENPDPLSGGDDSSSLGPLNLKGSENGETSEGDEKPNGNTIVVNDTKSLVDLANSKKEPGKEPTLVIIDTNAIMQGKGPVPLKNQSAAPPKSRHAPSIDIPDDAFLIEAPSFIVPYVFEQGGEKNLKEEIKDLVKKVKDERQAKLERGEELTEEDTLYEPKKPASDDYFDTPVGKLLTSIGMNMVQEFVQVDLLKMQKRQGEKEKAKSRMGCMTHLTQQSIISLKKNIEESKENNEPFRSKMKKCELCNFRTESELVMSTHQETPHMKNYSYRCNFCEYTTRVPQEVLFHMEAEHAVRARLERAPAYHQCPNCPFEDNSKAKLTRHLLGCVKRFVPAKNLEPPMEWDTPAKLPKLPKNRILPQGINPAFMAPSGQRMGGFNQMLPKQFPAAGMSMKAGNLPPLLHAAPKNKPIPGLIRAGTPGRNMQSPMVNPQFQRGMMMRGGGQVQAHNLSINNHMLPMGTQVRGRTGNQPSISITPLPRQGGNSAATMGANKSQGQGQGGKTSFVICEICDGYIKDLDQLRNHMQWIHKVKIHPKMIYNKPPLNCQKCQFRFFTDQGLERHLLGSHGLVTSSMQEAANKGQDSGRCPLCGKVYQWKLLAHVAKDHNVTLKPAHLSYKCTVCTATFGMYKLFESHVYSAHSVTKNAPRQGRVGGPAPAPGKLGQGGLQVTPRTMPNNAAQNNAYKAQPLKINDEITIIPQPMANSALQRNKGSLTITPQPMRRSVPNRMNEDEGIQIIEIDDAPQKNGMRPNGNRFSMSDTLRKRNLEISVCEDNADDSRGPIKRLRQN